MFISTQSDVPSACDQHVCSNVTYPYVHYVFYIYVFDIYHFFDIYYFDFDVCQVFASRDKLACQA